jgi:HK97 gp10 family phage protein
MPQSNFTVKITFNKFPEIAQAMPGKTAQVVSKTAFNVEANAKNAVPVDTGALKNSIDTEIASGGLSATVAPHTEYAHFVEFGTRRMSA